MEDSFEELTTTKIEELLTSIEVLNVSQEAIKILSQLIDTVSIKGGEVLMAEGEVGGCLYFLVYGSLRAYHAYKTPNQKRVGEIGANEVVGEIALFTEQPRTATVVAIRDSLLFKLDREAFELFSKQHPEIAMAIAKACIKRLVLAARDPQKDKNYSVIKTIALIPLTSDKLIQDFIDSLENELAANYKVLFLRSEDYKTNGLNIAWLHAQERIYQYILYVADSYESPWSALCIRQADCIYQIALSVDYNSSQPHKSLELTNNCGRVSLILLHKMSEQKLKQTHRWLNKLRVTDHYHILLDSKKDVQRASRIITDNSVAFVLSGGGARAYAHVGVLMALEEQGVPIDMVAGTSMGSVIAGMLALNFTIAEQVEVAKEFANRVKKLSIVFPYNAITDDSIMTNYLKEFLGEETRIEDTFLRFFCVSTDLCKNRAVIHTNGLLWQAVRASVSLPVIYPPVSFQETVLIDGGMINNLPVDEANQLYHPHKIIASSLIGDNDKLKALANPGPSIWGVINQYVNPLSLQTRVSYLPDIIAAAMVLNSSLHQLLMEKQADYCFLNDMSPFSLTAFGAYEEIIAKGYECATQQLVRVPLKRN